MKRLKNVSRLDIVLLCMTFYEITIIPHLVFIFSKYFILGYLLIKYRNEISNIRKVGMFIGIYGGVTFISTIINGASINTVVASFVYGIQILTIFLVVNKFEMVHGVDKLVCTIAYTFFLYIIITDTCMIVRDYDFSNPDEKYWIGNKFIVSYIHCFVVTLFYYLSSKKRVFAFSTIEVNDKTQKMIPWCLWGMSLIVAKTVTCTTGVIVILLLGICMLIPERIFIKFCTSKIILGMAVIMNFIFVGPLNLFNNEFLTGVMKNVLGKTYTWVGRLRIYDVVGDIISKQPLLGYGYFSDIVAETVSFGNAQNGVLKILVDSGIIGLIGYVGIVQQSLHGLDNTNRSYRVWYAFLYSMLLASLVEINITHMIVFCVLAILNTQKVILSRM